MSSINDSSSRIGVIEKIPHKNWRILRIIKSILLIFLDKDRKPLPRILREFLVASVTTRCIATHYFTGFLYKNGIDNYLDYLSHREWHHLQDVLDDDELNDILGDKIYFQAYYARSGIPLPRQLGYNIREKLFLEDKDAWVSLELVTPEATLAAIEKQLAASTNGSIFIKPIRGSGGHGMRRIRRSDVRQEMIAELQAYLVSGSFIFQDEVVQHREMARLNPSSLNTIRIDTFKAPGGRPEVLSAFLRMAMGDNCVDNIGEGGLYVGVNLEDGTLKQHAIRDLWLDAAAYTSHPKTGVQFQGFQIPFFEDVKRAAIEAADWIPKALVGWDIAVSETGPVVIEGNTRYYHTQSSDMTYGGYRRNPVYKKVVDYANKQITGGIMVSGRNNHSRIAHYIERIPIVYGDKQVYGDKDRKPLPRILREFLVTSVTTRCIATHYFTSFLYKSGIDNYLDYLSHREWHHLQDVLDDDELNDILGDKIYFQAYYERSGIPLPRQLGYNIREKLFLEDKDAWVSLELVTPEATLAAIEKQLAASTNGSIFIKPIRGSGGHGMRRIRRSDVQQEMIAELQAYLVSGSFIFQDEVVQHREMARLNPSSLNTIRIDTFKAPGGRPEVLSAFLRMAMGDNCVDNTGSGGLFVGVNLEDGTLKQQAIRELEFDAAAYASHPTTGVQFQGFQIPFFEDVKRAAIEAADWIPKALVGWDIAVSETGPVVIEGNARYYNLQASDMTYGGYRRNPVYKKVVDYVNKEIKQ